MDANSAPIAQASSIRNPKATLERLPAELVWMICDVAEPDAVFALRLASKTLDENSFNPFKRRFFKSMKFGVTPWSLKTLKEILEDENAKPFRDAIEHLEFGPDRLGDLFHEYLYECQDRWPERLQLFYEYLYECQLSWPERVQLHDWEETPPWEERYTSVFKERWEEEKRMHEEKEDVEILTRAFASFPNLHSITVDTREAYPLSGPDLKIRPCKGSIKLIEEVGIRNYWTDPPSDQLVAKHIAHFLLHGRNWEWYTIPQIMGAIEASGRGDISINLTLTKTLRMPRLPADQLRWVYALNRVKEITFDCGNDWFTSHTGPVIFEDHDLHLFFSSMPGLQKMDMRGQFAGSIILRAADESLVLPELKELVCKGFSLTNDLFVRSLSLYTNQLDSVSLVNLCLLHPEDTNPPHMDWRTILSTLRAMPLLQHVEIKKLAQCRCIHRCTPLGPGHKISSPSKTIVHPRYTNEMVVKGQDNIRSALETIADRLAHHHLTDGDSKTAWIYFPRIGN